MVRFRSKMCDSRSGSCKEFWNLNQAEYWRYLAIYGQFQTNWYRAFMYKYNAWSCWDNVHLIRCTEENFSPATNPVLEIFRFVSAEDHNISINRNSCLFKRIICQHLTLLALSQVIKTCLQGVGCFYLGSSLRWQSWTGLRLKRLPKS